MKTAKQTTTVQRASGTDVIMVARCNTCKHSERREIEYNYRHRLMSIPEMSKAYGINARSLYRHFDHAGLRAERNGDMLAVLDKVIDVGFEQGLDVRSEHVLRAVELRAKMTGKLQPDIQGNSFVSILQVLRSVSDTELAVIQLDADIDDQND